MRGRWMVLAAATLVAAVLLLLVTGRLEIRWGGSSGPERDEPGEKKGEETRAARTKLGLSVEEIHASGILTAPVALGSVATTLRLTARVDVADDRMARVTPRIAGTVRDVLVAVGDRVAVGAALATIESVELGEARAAHATALSESSFAARNLARLRELFEKGLKTQNELWAAENEANRARLNVESAGSKLRALGLRAEESEPTTGNDAAGLANRFVLRSPIAGHVLERHLTVGQSVETKDEVFVVADLSEVWVRPAVYEKDLPAIRAAMPAVVRVDAFTGRSFPGRVAYVGQQADEKTRTVPLRIAIANEPEPGSAGRFLLRPGMFATVDLEISRKAGIVVVPAAAVQPLGAESVVFVRVAAPAEATAIEGNAKVKSREKGGAGDEGSQRVFFERRAIRLGTREEEVVEVLEGLRPGDVIAVENSYVIKSEFERSRIGAESDE